MGGVAFSLMSLESWYWGFWITEVKGLSESDLTGEFLTGDPWNNCELASEEGGVYEIPKLYPGFFIDTYKQKAIAFRRFWKKCMTLKNNSKNHPLKFFSGVLESSGTLLSEFESQLKFFICKTLAHTLVSLKRLLSDKWEK